MLANSLRKTILKMAYNASSVHIGCAFSIVELVDVIYNNHINIEKLRANSQDRDYFCLSKGHGVMALYAKLHELNILTSKEIENYFVDGSSLTGLADSHVAGVEISGGSLGQGVTVATGIALSKKIDCQNSKVFCILGDGELNEGSVWESLMIASHHQLRNFIVVVDGNGFQAMGECQSVLNLESLRAKFEAFNFEVVECDGHDTAVIEKNLMALISSEKMMPKALIARTVKGKGVSFMENNNLWHYTRLTEETYKKAIAELEK